MGKRAVVPEGARVGRNCRIDPDATPKDFPRRGKVATGGTVQAAG